MTIGTVNIDNDICKIITSIELTNYLRASIQLELEISLVTWYSSSINSNDYHRYLDWLSYYDLNLIWFWFWFFTGIPLELSEYLTRCVYFQLVLKNLQQVVITRKIRLLSL